MGKLDLIKGDSHLDHTPKNLPADELRKKIENIYIKYTYTDSHLPMSPLYQITTEIISLHTQLINNSRISELERIDSDWDSYQLNDYKIDRLKELQDMEHYDEN